MTAPQRLTAIVYGKGGVGKSTVATHLAVALSRVGRRVLLIGCDPKTDTSIRLLRGDAPPTMLDVVAGRVERSLDRLIARTAQGVDIMETGGPEPGMGCGGRGVASLCELLDVSEARLAEYDAVIFDVLGDLVCGGFVSPLRYGFGSNVYIVSSEETASLYAANNIARVLCQPYYARVPLGGILFNLRGSEAPPELLHEFARRVGLEVLAILPRDPVILEAELEGQTTLEYAPDSDASRRFLALANALLAKHEVAERRPITPLNPPAFREFVLALRRAGLARARAANP